MEASTLKIQDSSKNNQLIANIQNAVIILYLGQLTVDLQIQRWSNITIVMSGSVVISRSFVISHIIIKRLKLS